MSKPSKRRQAQRREFLKGVAIAGGGAAVVASSGAVLADAGVEVGELAPPEAAKDGYRETSHVREYYDKARF